MKRKITNSLLFGAALLSTGVMSSCKDYDDDINSLNDRVTAVETSIAELQKKIKDGKWVVSLEQNAGKNGYVLTLSDGSKLEILNGKNGVDGTDGVNGKNGTTWEIDPDTKNWIMIDSDGKRIDTGIKAEGEKGEVGSQGPAGQPGQSPIIDENGMWAIYNPETGKYETTEYNAGTQTSYVVVFDAYYELNIASGSSTGEYIKIILPKTDSISSMNVYSLKDGVLGDPTVTLNIGRAESDIKFNGKTYKKDQVLVGASTGLVAQINPLEADASLYKFTLWNSKGQAEGVTVSAAKQNKSEKPLKYSRAVTENKGFWDLTINMASGIDANVFNTDAAYSLHTTTLKEETTAVVSEYNISFNVKTRETSAKNAISCTFQIGEAHSWESVVEKAIDGGTPDDVVDCYLEIPESKKEQAKADGVVLASNTLTFNKTLIDGIDYVEYHYLTMNGKHESIKLKLAAANIQTVSLEKDFSYTVGAKEKTIRVAVSELGLLDELVKDGEVRNDVEYSFNKDFNKGEYVYVDGLPVAVQPAELNEILGGVKFVKDQKVDGKWYVEMTFDDTKVFAEPYSAKLILMSNDQSETRELNFNINIAAPIPFDLTAKRDAAYFNGSVAKVYARPTGEIAKYDVKNLYKGIDNTTWNEILFSDGSSSGWFQELDKSEINVPNKDVNNPHKVVVLHRPYKNANLNSTKDEITVEFRSEIYDGEITYSKQLSVSNTVTAVMNISDFKFLDFKNNSYKVNGNEKDERVVGVSVSLVGDAGKYIKLDDSALSNGKVVISRADDTVIVNPQTCKVKLSVKDIWGQTKECTIDVVAK